LKVNKKYLFFFAIGILAAFISFRVPHPKSFKSETYKVYSTQVNDSFDIQVHEHITGYLTYPEIISYYILVSEIDNRVDRLHDSLLQYDSSHNFRIIGIGQTHFSKLFRKRDFVPSADGKFLSKRATYSGHADQFYDFILEDIIPTYDPYSGYRVLIGHSFGGLFGVYTSTQEDCPFSAIHALSPSLWVNYSDAKSTYEQDTSIHIHTNLDIHYGSLERLNKVANAAEEFGSVLRPADKKKVNLKKVDWATHMSILEEIYTREVWY
jgi:hypothetical protein